MHEVMQDSSTLLGIEEDKSVFESEGHEDLGTLAKLGDEYADCQPLPSYF